MSRGPTRLTSSTTIVRCAAALERPCRAESPALRFAERFSAHFARPRGANPPAVRNRPELLELEIGRHAAPRWHMPCGFSRTAGTRGVASFHPSLPPPARPRTPPQRNPGARRPLRPRAPCICRLHFEPRALGGQRSLTALKEIGLDRVREARERSVSGARWSAGQCVQEPRRRPQWLHTEKDLAAHRDLRSTRLCVRRKCACDNACAPRSVAPDTRLRPQELRDG